MSILLAIDNSGDIFSAAVGAAQAQAPDYCEEANTPHAHYALPLIQSLLARQRYSLSDCGAFAFAGGPGKFSALRLSCAIARTFAYAHDKPLFAVPGFAALAQLNYGKAEEGLAVKCALPAHQNHIYFGVCRLTRGKWRVEKTALHPGDGKAPAAKITQACGYGYQQYPKLLATARYNSQAAYSNAYAVWQVAVDMWKDNENSDPLTCQPFYLRNNVAQTIRQRSCAQTASKN